jgi:O-antigen/teichoic acid export membrane protein
MSIRHRIYLTLAAGAFGQLVTIGSQILLTPLYFLHWGADKYGEWLLISTIPAYLVMADFGIGSAAGNEMTMRAGAGYYEEAQRTFRGAIWLCGIASISVMTISIIVAMVCLQFNIPSTNFITSDEVALIIFLFGLNVSLGFFLSAISNGFRCCGKNATGIFMVNVSRLIEVLATGIVLWLDYSPVYVCLTGLIVKSALGIPQALFLRSVCSWLFTPKCTADHSIVKRLIKPSLAFLAFPIGNALALQVPLLLLGTIFGSAAVAIFSALRTLARIPYQLMNLFNTSVGPEMSIAYGSGNMALLRRLHRSSWMITMIIVLLISTGIIFFGELIVNTWLHKIGLYNGLILDGLLVVSFFSSMWGLSSIVLSSVNAHLKMTTYFLIINATGCLLSYFMSIYLGMHGFIFSLILVEVMIMMFVLPMALKISQDSLRGFAGSILKRFAYNFGNRLNDGK